MTIRCRIVRTRVAVAAWGLITAQILAGAPESLAQPFEIIGLGEDKGWFETGEVEFAAISAYQTGFPGEAEEATHFASELSIGLSLAKFLMIESGVVLTKERGGDLTASNVAFEATLARLMLPDPGLGAGFFLAVEPRIDEDATNEFVFGPIFQLGDEDGFQVTINPFFEETFGRNSEEGLAFAYGWQVKVNREVEWNAIDAVAFGVEGYGEIEDVFGDPPDFDDQEHRIGPVIYLGGKIFGERAKFEVSFGVLAGVTRETPDVAFRLNVEISPEEGLW